MVRGRHYRGAGVRATTTTTATASPLSAVVSTLLLLMLLVLPSLSPPPSSAVFVTAATREPAPRSVQYGSVQDGSVQDGSAQYRSAQDGSVQYGSAQDLLRRLGDGILDLIAVSLRRQLVRFGRGAVAPPDVNLMLGVSVAKGQLKSCTDHSRLNDYSNTLDQIYILIDKLYAKFYKNQSQDLETIRKILDCGLWTSAPKIIRKSHIALPRDFDEDSIATGDLKFRNLSDKCIHQVISACEITPECLESELADGFSGYALTHQVLYIHIFKKMNCVDLMFQQMADKIIQHKCSMIFNEAQYIANDLNTLERYKDLFTEQSKTLHY